MFVYIRSAAFIIVVTQKLVLQQSKNVTAKCTETLSPPPSIQYLLGNGHVFFKLRGSLEITPTIPLRLKTVNLIFYFLQKQFSMFSFV